MREHSLTDSVIFDSPLLLSKFSLFRSRVAHNLQGFSAGMLRQFQLDVVRHVSDVSRLYTKESNIPAVFDEFVVTLKACITAFLQRSTASSSTLSNVVSDGNSPIGAAASTEAAEIGAGATTDGIAIRLQKNPDEGPRSEKKKRTRDDEKPVFTCTLCSHLPFSKRGNLENHLRKVHNGRRRSTRGVSSDQNSDSDGNVFIQPSIFIAL